MPDRIRTAKALQVGRRRIESPPGSDAVPSDEIEAGALGYALRYTDALEAIVRLDDGRTAIIPLRHLHLSLGT